MHGVGDVGVDDDGQTAEADEREPQQVRDPEPPEDLERPGGEEDDRPDPHRAGADEEAAAAEADAQRIVDAPASISVIDRADLQDKRFGSLAEAMVDVQGIDVGGEAGKTGGLNISIRGMGANFTRVLLNGAPIRPSDAGISGA